MVVKGIYNTIDTSATEELRPMRGMARSIHILEKQIWYATMEEQPLI